MVLVLALPVLSACAETEFLIHSAKRVGSAVDGEAAAPDYKIGKPYQIQGVWYYPAENFELEETGIASWYGAQFHGRRTANGDIYDMNALTAAHRTLPMPSFVRVTNLENGRSLILKVNDRGPFARNRIIDISRRGAQLLGFHNVGTARVRVQIMADQSRAIAARMRSRTRLASASTPITVGRLPKPDVASESLAPPPGAKVASAQAPPVEPPAPPSLRRVASRTPLLPDSDTNVVTVEPVKKTNIYIQAGAFSRFNNANKAQARLSPIGLVKISSVLIKGQDLFRVRVGPLDTVAEADKMLKTVTQAGYPNALIVVE